MKTRLLSLLLSAPVLIAMFGGGWLEAFTRSWHDGH
jgi:hypothetical protein